MLELFGKRYKAVSNLFIKTYEGKDYIFPSPFNIYGQLENEAKNTKSELVMNFSSYLDSPLIVEYYFDLFFYLLSFEYKIETVMFYNLKLDEYRQEMYGYKGTFKFLSDDITFNIGDTEIYGNYTKN